LENKCHEFGIRFELVRVDSLVRHILDNVVKPWVNCVFERPKIALQSEVSLLRPADVNLLIDGDRTLTPMNTGRAFFGTLQMQQEKEGTTDPLKVNFSGMKATVFKPS
jgi:hypothetical protein